MALTSDLSTELKVFFDQEKDHIFKRFDIFLCRNDGVLVYNTSKLTDSVESVGVLLCGMWQAADALSSFLPTRDADECFRLCFDTSSNGIYVLPVNVDSMEYYLGAIFYDELNPGMIKLKLRELKDRLRKFIKKELFNTKHSDKGGQYLFKNISDEEMDKLFSFSRT